MNHTKGPWRVDPKHPLCIESAAGNIGLVNLARASEADAALMAAAPELFDAAMQAKDFLIRDLEEPGRTVFWKLIAALKKAGWSAPTSAGGT